MPNSRYLSQPGGMAQKSQTPTTSNYTRWELLPDWLLAGVASTHSHQSVNHSLQRRKTPLSRYLSLWDRDGWPSPDQPPHPISVYPTGGCMTVWLLQRFPEIEASYSRRKCQTRISGLSDETRVAQ